MKILAKKPVLILSKIGLQLGLTWMILNKQYGDILCSLSIVVGFSFYIGVTLATLGVHLGGILSTC